MLCNHEIGKKALINRDLLTEVIKVKKTFYDSGFAKYDDCSNGNLHLVPNDDYLKLLNNDFNEMLNNKMFYGEQPDFDTIIAQIKKLEHTVNGK
jgi:hypothetical protein